MSKAATVQVAEGARCLSLRTPTLPPASTTNTLLLVGERVLVIEPATPHEAEQRRLRDEIEALEAEGHVLAGIAITHHHTDHIGFADRLRQDKGVPLLAHERTAERVSFEVDQTIDESWSMDLGAGHVIEAFFTPGHAPGHLVFWDASIAVAHVGDLVAGIGTIVVDPEDDGDMGVYIESLGRMAAYFRGHPQARLVPAHGPVITDPVENLLQTIEHRLGRERKLVAALEGGATGFEDLLAATYADTPPELHPLAKMSLEAHLRKLESEGRVLRDGLGATLD